MEVISRREKSLFLALISQFATNVGSLSHGYGEPRAILQSGLRIPCAGSINESFREDLIFEHVRYGDSQIISREREREKRRGEKSKKEHPLDNKERCNIIGFYFSRLSQDMRLSSLSVGSSRFNFWDKEFSLSLSLFFSLC